MGWIIDPVIDDNFNISYNNTLAGSSYIKLPEKLDHRKKKVSLIIKTLTKMNALNGFWLDTYILQKFLKVF